MSKRIPKIAVPASHLVIVTDDYSGDLAGDCLMCGNHGWLDPRYGVPAKSKIMSNRLHHAPRCPVGQVLNDNGTWK